MAAAPSPARGSEGFRAALARALGSGTLRHESIPAPSAAAMVAADLASKGKGPDARGLYRIVEACYLDEATPDDTLLQWLLWRAFGVEIALDELRQTAAKASGLSVRPKATKKNGFTAQLDFEPRWFRGFKDQPDTDSSVAIEAWSEAASLMLQGGWALPEKTQHERFTLAAWLRQRGEATATLSFGCALHIVYHVISSKSVLGKRDGRLVPYPLSEDYEKQENARCFRPTGTRGGEESVSSWPEFERCLRQLLVEGPHAIAPSALKRTFRARFGVELSETALGHTSMTSLLEDPRFQASFAVHAVPGKADEIYLLQ